MNINRNNYEEFFLLYVDNELTAGQRKIVEAFVSSNPDLQEELNLIQQSVFNGHETLDRSFKTSLLKPIEDESGITTEQLLLYVDDELSLEEKISLEKVLVANVSLQKELSLLKQSKLEADNTLVFPDKSVLYKEPQPARVFFMNYVSRRWSAAAAIILLLGTAFWILINNTNIQNSPLVTKPPVITEEKKPVIEKIPITENKLQQDAVTKKVKTDNRTTPTIDLKSKPIVNQVKEEIAKSTNKPVIKQNSFPELNPVKQETAIAKNETATIITPENNSTKNSNNSTTSIVPQKTNTATTYSYASYNNDEDSENDDVLFNEERQRRSGLKGWVKKAKRLIERNTGIHSTDSEVRFAVFAINTQ